jgi:putative transposase
MPTPEAIVISLSSSQQQLLEQMVRCTTHPYRLVRRAKLILWSAQGVSNTAISQHLDLQRAQVRLWRQRWHVASLRLSAAEEKSETALRQAIFDVLSDEARPGTRTKFSVEQIVQIVAVACEPPEKSDRPITHWTPMELADEVRKRGIVEMISPRSVGRFLKRGDSATAPQSLLAQCSAR